ncbi:MAG: response regulator transcription factor, partial [Flavobacteriaceae bacterium]|nr:response regulator transcription factor [Flavobacteriaceae bacterium]
NKILLVEDDESLGYLLSEYLKMKNFDIVWKKNGVSALETLDRDYFDLIILDVMMPEMDGFTLANKIKQQFTETPFIFLTSRSLKIDVLKGFSLGAVDYLKKPIDEEELVVRLNTLLNTLSVKKSSSNSSQNEFLIGDYIYNKNNLQLVYKDGIIQKLTFRENKLLYLLVLKQNELCTHKEILNNIWGKNDFFSKKSLNVFISRLRKYLAKDSSIKIENIHNLGFIFKIE